MGKGDGKRRLLRGAGSSHGGTGKAVLTGLRGPVLPPLPLSPAGKPTVFQAEADQWGVLATRPRTQLPELGWGGRGGKAGAAQGSLEGVK